MNNVLEAALYNPKVNLLGGEGSIKRVRDCSARKTCRILVNDTNIAHN